MTLAIILRARKTLLGNNARKKYWTIFEYDSAIQCDAFPTRTVSIMRFSKYRNSKRRQDGARDERHFRNTGGSDGTAITRSFVGWV